MEDQDGAKLNCDNTDIMEHMTTEYNVKEEVDKPGGEEGEGGDMREDEAS